MDNEALWPAIWAFVSDACVVIGMMTLLSGFKGIGMIRFGYCTSEGTDET